MPSPPLPPRIALTDDPPVILGHGVKKSRRTGAAIFAGEVSSAGQSFTNWLSLIVVVLMVALAGAIWKGSKTSEQAEAMAKQAATAWKFGDGVLEDLAKARDQSAKLAGERETLIRVLGEAERLHAGLRREFSSWQQKREEVAAGSQRTLAQMSQDSQALEKSLGSAQAELAESGQALRQERMTSQQQVAQLDDEKNRAESAADALAQQKAAVEREAGALDQEAKDLDSNNGRLRAEIARLHHDISLLETENTAEQLRSASLSSEAAKLRHTVSSLESRLQAVEKERDKAKQH